VVTGFNIADGGDDYIAGQTVPFSTHPPGSTDATATVDVVRGELFSINVDEGGQGYVAAPAVQIIGDGTGAAAHCTMSNGTIQTVVIDAAGTNYTYAYIKFIVAPINENTVASGATAGLSSVTFSAGVVPRPGTLVTFLGSPRILVTSIFPLPLVI